MAKNNRKGNNRKNNDKPRFKGQVKGAAKAAQSAKVQQTLSTPQVGQRPGQSATVYAPGVTPPSQPTPSRTTPKIKGLGQGIRVAGENGIGKNELRKISEATGKDPGKIIGKLDKINTKLDTKGKAGIDLKSGAGNMLVRNAQKSPRGFGINTSPFGKGAIGSTLQSMLSTPAMPGIMVKGHRTGGRPEDPGFNPGGHPDKNRMIGGTVLRADGGIANKGAGDQYKMPKQFTGEKRDEDTPRFKGQLKGAARDAQSAKVNEILSNPQVGQRPGEVATVYGPGEEIPNTGDITTDDDDKTETTAPEGGENNSASSGAGGLDLASWATSFKRARSARQKLGSRAQGLASQKKNPFKSWA